MNRSEDEYVRVHIKEKLQDYNFRYREFMKPGYILFILLMLIVISIFFVTNGHKSGINISTNVSVNNSINISGNFPTSNINTNISETSNEETNLDQIVTKNVCEGCHMSGKGSVPQALNVKPHLDGGMFCLTCHNFSHDTHPINKDVTCEKCHGSRNESIPVSGPNIVCINCHNYPNPLEKSMGNLVTIHRPREISCINCHVDTCTKCHKVIGNDTRWENRIAHFNTILNLKK